MTDMLARNVEDKKKKQFQKYSIRFNKWSDWMASRYKEAHEAHSSLIARLLSNEGCVLDQEAGALQSTLVKLICLLYT